MVKPRIASAAASRLRGEPGREPAARGGLFRRFGARPWIAVGVVAAAVVAGLSPTSASWVEHSYSRQWYPAWQNVVTPVSSLFGFSLLDLLAIVAVLGLAASWWRGLRRSGRGLSRRAAVVARLTLHTTALAAALYLVFLAMWGLNYRREPLTAKLDYDAARISPASLAALAVESVERLNALHAPAHGAGPWPAFEDLPGRFAPAFDRVQRRLGARRPAVAGLPKPTLLTPYFRRAGIDGMLSPFSLEVLVNATVLPFERPFLVGHEWSHLAGYANEAEASFVGVLICLAGDVQSRYSAWLYLSQQLVRHLPGAERDRVWGRLDDGPRHDLRAIAARLREAVPVVRRNASRVYDRYLRANRVDAGIASYGLVVDLLLGTEGTPAWRELAGPIGLRSAAPPPAPRR